MQQTLQNKYKEKWGEIKPEDGKMHLLYMIGEVSEVTDIVKKNGEAKVFSDEEIRNHLIEELADVLMYYGNILLCYDIKPADLKKAFVEKFEKNLNRW